MTSGHRALVQGLFVFSSVLSKFLFHHRSFCYPYALLFLPPCSGLDLHGGSLRRTRRVPAAVGWWAASVVATVTGDHARRSQGSQQTADKSLCSAIPADSGWRKPWQWYRRQEQVCTRTRFHAVIYPEGSQTRFIDNPLSDIDICYKRRRWC